MAAGSDTSTIFGTLSQTHSYTAQAANGRQFMHACAGTTELVSEPGTHPREWGWIWAVLNVVGANKASTIETDPTTMLAGLEERPAGWLTCIVCWRHRPDLTRHLHQLLDLRHALGGSLGRPLQAGVLRATTATHQLWQQVSTGMHGESWQGSSQGRVLGLHLRPTGMQVLCRHVATMHNIHSAAMPVNRMQLTIRSDSSAWLPASSVP